MSSNDGGGYIANVASMTGSSYADLALLKRWKYAGLGRQLEILQNIRMTQYFRGIQAISFSIHSMSWLGLRASLRTALTWNHYIRFNMTHQYSMLLK